MLDLSTKIQLSKTSKNNKPNQSAATMMLRSQTTDNLLQPPRMNPRIIRQFRMKARPHNRALTNRNDIPSITLSNSKRKTSLCSLDPVRKSSQDFYLWPVAVGENLLHHGGADEDAGELLRVAAAFTGEEGQLDGGSEALHLATKVVAMDADAETADEGLAALFGAVGFVAEEDEAGACSPDRFLLNFDEITQWLQQARLLSNKGDGSALATGDHQGIASSEFLDGAHFNGLESEIFGDDARGSPVEQLNVLGEATLKGQDANCEGHHFRGRMKLMMMRTIREVKGVMRACEG